MPWIDNEYGGYWEPDQSLAVQTAAAPAVSDLAAQTAAAPAALASDLAVQPTSPYSAVGMADESAYNDIMLQMLGYSDPNAPDLTVSDPNILRIYQDPTLRMPSWMTSANYDARGSTPARYVTYNPGKQYILYDEASKKVLGQAADEASYRDLVSIVNNTLAPKGRQANWRLYQVNDTTAGPGVFGPDQLLKGENGAPDRYLELLGGDLYNKSALSTIADIAAATAAGVLAPMTGGASLFLAPALVGAAQGKSFTDILKNIAITTGSSLAGGALFSQLGSGASGAPGALSSAAGDVAGDVAGGLGGSLAGAAGNEIVVTAARNLAPSFLGSAVGSLAASGLTSAMKADLAAMGQTTPLDSFAVKPTEPTLPESEIVVEAKVQAAADAIRANPNISLGELSRMGLDAAQTDKAIQLAKTQQITVEANKPVVQPTSDLAVSVPMPTPGLTDYVAPPTDPITVEALKKPVQPEPTPVSVPVPTPGLTDYVAPPTDPIVVEANKPAVQPEPPPVVVPPLAVTPTEPNLGPEVGPLVQPFLTAAQQAELDALADPKAKTDYLDKIKDAARVAALVSGAVGGGAGSGAGAGTYTGTGTGTMGPVFNDPLPTGAGVTTIPGGVGTIANLAARTMPEQDWNKYAFKPEQSFFKYVPQAAPAALARGGQPSFAVRGEGDGRSDSIPAVLSDGEYVMDAETVALLGNGSSKAGAKKLDEMRVNIRKQKGHNLARGQFSVKAKQPEAYLAGGRT